MESGSTFSDAYTTYETELEDATTSCAEYVVENDIDLETIVENLEADAATTATETTETTEIALTTETIVSTETTVTTETSVTTSESTETTV
jgi:hypothetical protein